MKSKRSILLCLALVLSMAMAMGSTLAYLQDSDSDVNVMTLGDVDIDQIEQQRGEEGALVDFTSKEGSSTYVELNPGVYLDGLTTDESTGYYAANVYNAVDKIVSVKNVGSRAAYVRTMFAFEQGSLAGGELEKLLYINWNSAVEPERLDDDVEIDGKLYTVYQVVYPEPLGFTEPNNTTAPSLLQVLLSKEAEREDMQALDPDGDGLYEIKVVSQAVQAAGFESVGAKTALEEAFGTHFPGAVVYKTVNSAEDLVAALSEGGRIQLGADMTWTMAEDFEQNKEVTLDLNGKTITMVSSARQCWKVNAPLEVKDSVGGGEIYSRAGIQFKVYDEMTVTGGSINLAQGAVIVYNDATMNVSGETARIYSENGTGIKAHSNLRHEGEQGVATINVTAGTISGYSVAISTENGRKSALNISGGTIESRGKTSEAYGVKIQQDAVVKVSGSPKITVTTGKPGLLLGGGELDMSALAGDGEYTITQTGGKFIAPSADIWDVSSEGTDTIHITPKAN